jgi:hypothetical protein
MVQTLVAKQGWTLRRRMSIKPTDQTAIDEILNKLLGRDSRDFQRLHNLWISITLLSQIMNMQKSALWQGMTQFQEEIISNKFSIS